MRSGYRNEINCHYNLILHHYDMFQKISFNISYSNINSFLVPSEIQKKRKWVLGCISKESMKLLVYKNHNTWIEGLAIKCNTK